MEKVTFYDLYKAAKEQPRPLEIFIDEVARLVECSPATVKLWAVGKQRPDRFRTKAIAKHFGVDPDNLFPDYNGLTARQAMEGASDD